MTDTTAKTFRFSELTLNGTPIGDFIDYKSVKNMGISKMPRFLTAVSGKLKGSEDFMFQAFLRQICKEMDRNGYFKECAERLRVDKDTTIYTSIIQPIMDEYPDTFSKEGDFLFNWASVDESESLDHSCLQTVVQKLSDSLSGCMSGYEYVFVLLHKIMGVRSFCSIVDQYAHEVYSKDFFAVESVLDAGKLATVSLASDCKHLYEDFMLHFYEAAHYLISNDIPRPLAPCYKIGIDEHDAIMAELIDEIDK